MMKSTKRTPKLSIVRREEIDISTSIGVVLADLAEQGKSCLDALSREMGARLVEAILLAEREPLGGAAYHPREGFKKWSSQGGSVYIAGGKAKVRVPRLRDENGEVVMAAIGVDAQGYKRVLGLWQGSSENTEMCRSFLSDMESRGLALHPDIIFVTDGGTGLNRALKDRFGKDLKHQRCVIHKRRNVESHLPEMYRAEFDRRYNNAIGMVNYEDARRELLKVHEWLEGINTSAAKSLSEGGERLLTVHRLGIPAPLRKSLITTNIIESTFNGLDSIEKNVKRYRDIEMFKRWMAAEVLHREKTGDGWTAMRKSPNLSKNFGKRT